VSFIIYEDDALVVLDKPAGCSSEEGVPQRLREQWGKPDAYVGVIHRLDTGVSGLMVYAKTPQAAATARMLTAAQPFCWISSRLVFRMSALDVAIGFIHSPSNMNNVHDAQYTAAVGCCQGENKIFCSSISPSAQRQETKAAYTQPVSCFCHLKCAKFMSKW